MPKASALAEVLRQNGISVSCVERTKLNVRPRSALTPAIAELVRYYKPELCRLLKNESEKVAFQPFACSHCDQEFVLRAGELCPWCKALGDSWIAIPANSSPLTRNQQFREELSPTVPT